ncbi:RpiB/LacA/LacB family sugar-phosphate isomerase [Candidatus Gottesmanbacteria bacterium]|nr:RpiB/LacA/LacB family sugar-phosphate isomerase [Candidatus Gottesmanbacteria bacterium]
MIYLGSDHGGFDLKEKIKIWLTKWGYPYEDLGNVLYEKEDDYPSFAIEVAQKVATEERNGNGYPKPWQNRPKGIITCRSAAGMVIAANKVKGARCATAFDSSSAKHCRAHNDVNVIALSGDWLEEYQAKKILNIWLETEFSGEERHIRRLKEIEEFEATSV